MGYKVKGCSGPIWHSMEPQVPLMHNKLEDALLTVRQVCEIIYEVVSVWNKEALDVMTSVIWWCWCCCRFLCLGMML